MTGSVPDAVRALARLSRVLERAAAPLSLADFRALSAIAAGEERASRLARRLAVGKPSISATVDSLARRGLISRERASGDQRAFVLAITPEGRAVHDVAEQQMSVRLGELATLTENPDAGIQALVALGDALEAAHAAHVAQLAHDGHLAAAKGDLA